MSQCKFVIASQAGVIYGYKNLKHKILKFDANIQFNRQCLKFNLVPKYANVEVHNASPGSQFTQRKVGKMRIKDKINIFAYEKRKN
jgi:hypothetical protein